MINKIYNYAVIWASNNKEKYWYKVLSDLLKNWYKVIPVNPNEKKEILNQKVYKTISNINTKIDVAIFVVQPKITEIILKEIKSLWIKNVRLQPWAENKEAINYCKENNITCIHNACIMIKRKH